MCPASRTSGWRRLIISSRGGRNRSSWRSSRGWLIGLPRQRISPSKEITNRPHRESQTARKPTCTPGFSCKIDYLLRSNHRDRSIASEFFTDDSLDAAFRPAPGLAAGQIPESGCFTHPRANPERRAVQSRGNACRAKTERGGASVSYPFQSSSASRFTAGASEFFILSQSGERPER